MNFNNSPYNQLVYLDFTDNFIPQFKINPGVLDEPVETSSGWWSWMFGENTINKKETEEGIKTRLTSVSLSVG